MLLLVVGTTVFALDTGLFALTLAAALALVFRDTAQRATKEIAWPVVLLVCGIVSAFASTTGILGALMPLAAPFLSSGALTTTGLVIALSSAATLVDASPFSTNGALVVANTPETVRAGAYRGLLRWGPGCVRSPRLPCGSRSSWSEGLGRSHPRPNHPRTVRAVRGWFGSGVRSGREADRAVGAVDEEFVLPRPVGAGGGSRAAPRSAQTGHAPRRRSGSGAAERLTTAATGPYAPPTLCGEPPHRPGAAPLELNCLTHSPRSGP
ncbi:hypothetical protein [Streptomyces sp. RPA4-5]|uniref:hypothetical protein n=1 Tax=Streptomyces sp. RPA4-5 TaxID=2721245 RepID=UPI0032B3513A